MSIDNLDILNKKYIIFDLDGTLIDSIGVWNTTDQKLIKLLSGKNIDLNTIQQEREKFLELNLSSDIYLEYGQYLIEKYNMKITKEELLNLRWEISTKYLENYIDFKPFVPEFIKQLKELGFTLVLATVTTKEQIDIYCNRNNNMKFKLKLDDYFDLIVKKEDVQHKKPNPEIYLKVLEHYNAKPKECLVFEDSLHGVIASKTAGIETVNIYDKYSDNDREKLNKISDFTTSSFEEVIKLLNDK